MIEFFVSKLANDYELIADGLAIGTFATEGLAADFAIRFAQDTDAVGYRIFY